MSEDKEINQGYFIRTPLVNQAQFSMVLVFKEQTSYIRNYICPYNMISICLRAEGQDASVMTNLKTGEIHSTRENEILMIPHNLPQQYHHTLRFEQLSIQFRLELFPGVDVFSGQDSIFVEYSPDCDARPKKFSPPKTEYSCSQNARHTPWSSATATGLPPIRWNWKK